MQTIAEEANEKKGPPRLTAEELQAARRAAAARLEAIAAKHTPAAAVVAFRKSLTGLAAIRRDGREAPWLPRIWAPRPVTRRALAVYLHECAHHWLGHTGGPFGQKNPRHVEEYQAELWAFATMRAEGVPVPRRSTDRAKGYVARKIHQAKVRGAKRIDPAAARYAKKGAITRLKREVERLPDRAVEHDLFKRLLELEARTKNLVKQVREARNGKRVSP
jgi:hypothetical protein